MTPEQFAYWLHGFCELNGNTAPTPAQWKAISAHLDTVFKKVTPSVAEVKPAESDIQKSMREYLERPRQVDQSPALPWPPQPFQWGPMGYPPGTIIC
jgi:hypothetical protein